MVTSRSKNKKEAINSGGNLPKQNLTAKTKIDTQNDIATQSKNFALKFSLLKDKLKADADTEPDKSTIALVQKVTTGSASDEINPQQTASKKPTITPGCDSEHLLQEKWGTRDRALNFYDRQVLDYLAPKMQEFIARQEFLFGSVEASWTIWRASWIPRTMAP